MSPLFETIAFVFGLVALGYICAWSGLLRAATGDALTEFAVAVAVPALLFRTMIAIDFSQGAPWRLWIAYFTAIAVTWAAGHFIVTRVFGRDARAGVIGGISSSFSNLVLLGVPFMLGVFGQPGFEVLSLLVAVHLPVMMALSILLFEWASRGERKSRPVDIARDFLVKLLSNPLIVAIIVGLAWRATGLGLPALAVRFVDSLAGVAGTIALFAMGLSLRRFGLSGNIGPSVAVASLKLFLMPAVALAMAMLLDLPPFVAKIAVAAASLPSGVNPYLVATRFGTGQALASNTMTLATAFAVVSTAFWLAVAQMVLG